MLSRMEFFNITVSDSNADQRISFLSHGHRLFLLFRIFLEEVHNLFPRNHIESQANSSLESLFREIRSFGEGLVFITQHPSLTPIYLTGNSNTLIILGLQNEDDLMAAKKALFLQRDEDIYIDSLKVGEGIVKIKGRINPCHVKFPLVENASQKLPEADMLLRQLAKLIKIPGESSG